jgi:hypothetical protein
MKFIPKVAVLIRAGCASSPEKASAPADIFTEDLTIKSPVPGGIVCEDPILPPWFCPTP